MRTLVCMATVLLVFGASIQLAAARGQASPVDTLVICTGSGPIHILVDENGQPTGGVMICPDYALAFFAETNTTTPDALHRVEWHALWQSHTDALAAGHTALPPQARDPPQPV